MRPRFAAFALTVLLGTAPAGCASLSPVRGGFADGGRVVTREQIVESGATNAWEAIRRLLPGVSLTEDRHGNPSKLRRRGASSMLLEDRPAVFLDGVRLSGLDHLIRVPAREISSITLLSGIDGSTRYGTNAGDGVILIRMRTGLDRP